MIGNHSLMNDTLHLIQLAQETSRRNGNMQQADKLEPVVNQFKELINREMESTTMEAASGDATTSFQKILSTSNGVQNQRNAQLSLNDRNRMITSLSEGGMTDVQIARELNITRDEVRLVINLANAAQMNRR
jgi:DNA-binding NarL/FixJ family response regulator